MGTKTLGPPCSKIQHLVCEMAHDHHNTALTTASDTTSTQLVIHGRLDIKKYTPQAKLSVARFYWLPKLYVVLNIQN
jgi:hypothetical protein